MGRRALVTLGFVLLLAIVFYGGFLFGNHSAFRRLITSLEAEVSGSHNLRIEQLAYLRSGELDRAIELLEVQVAAALASLPQGREWSELSPPVRDRADVVG